MSKAADEKRWAILPPPSATSAAYSGRLPEQVEPSRRQPARRAISGEILNWAPELGATIESAVQELEPSDSERVTEVPPFSHERERFLDGGAPTIPAPAWPDEAE